MIANGLNYHELSHVLYTPHGNHPLLVWVRANAHQAQSFNILEDCRIEGIMTRRFPVTRNYFTALVAEFFLNIGGSSSYSDPSQIGRAWPIVAGRTYLPGKMIDFFRSQAYAPDALYAPENLKKIEHVIAEYLGLRFADDRSSTPAVNRAIALIQRFNQLTSSGLPSLNPVRHGQSVSGSSHGDDVGMPGGESTTMPSSADPGDDASGSASGTAGDDQGGADDGAAGGASGDTTSDSDDQGRGQGDTTSADQPGGTGSSAGRPGTDLGDDPGAVLTDVLTDVMADASLIGELTKTRKMLTGNGNRFNGVLGDVRGDKLESASAGARAQAKAFRRELSRMSEDADPGFDKFRDSGRLNVGRAIRGDGLDTLFDQWSEGKTDASSLEVVVILDRSGSMGGAMSTACEAAWTIKYAIDGLGGDARCSVITFADNTEYLYRPNDQSQAMFRSVRTLGGTTVRFACQEALYIFNKSTRAKKIFISVSDGSWDDRNKATPFIERMKRGGVTTAALFLASGPVRDMYNRMPPEVRATELATLANECAIFQMADQPSAITAMGKRLVKAAMRG